MVIIILFILLAFSALFSGLTVGLMGLDIYSLRRKIKSGNKDALKVYEIRKDGTLLLTTLLLGNVAVNAIISIILGNHLNGVLAAFVATGIIFIICEILPQAVMSRYGMKFGVRFAWIVKIAIFLFYPICKPISWALNKFLGHEKQSYMNRKELVNMLDEYEGHLPESAIDSDEQRIARGSLMFSHKTVADVMTPNTVALLLESSQVLDEAFFQTLKQSGFSRFPVYENDKNNIIGILYIKDLIGVLPGVKVKDIYDPYIHTVHPENKLDLVLNQFIQKRMHLFIVSDEFGGFEGVISLEDVLEQILDTEIVDEDDKHPDLRSVAKSIIAKKSKK